MDLRPLRPGLLGIAVGLSSLGAWLWVGPAKHELDGRIVSLAVSASGRWITTGTEEGWVTVWNRESGRGLQHIHAAHGKLNDLQFSPDERLLAIANSRLAVHPVEDLGLLRSILDDDRNYGIVRFSADGKRLLTVTGAATIETLDAESGATQLKICCSTIGGEVAFSPDGKMIANAGHWPALWDAQSGQLIRRLTREREFLTFRPIAFDERRGVILMGSQDGRVYGWDMRSGVLMWCSAGSRGYVDSIVVLKNTGWIAYATTGEAVRLWNPDTGEKRQIESARPSSNLVADGDSILFGTAAGAVEVWDTRELTKNVLLVPTR